MCMDMSWKWLTQLLQATSPTPVSPSLSWSHHLLGLLQIACSGTHFPFQLNSHPLCPRPISTWWLKFNRRSNQGLMRLISQNLGWFVFSNKPSFLGFSFMSRSLATLWLTCSTTLNCLLAFARANRTYIVGSHAMAPDSADIRLSHDLGSHDLLVHYLIMWLRALILVMWWHVIWASMNNLIP